MSKQEPKLAFQCWEPEKYVAGVWVEERQEWLGKFHATEEELYSYLEKDCDDELESLLILQMVDALKWSEIAIERMVRDGRKRRKN